MSWLIPFSDNERHQKVWQKGIQTAKDMFKVDGTEYIQSTLYKCMPLRIGYKCAFREGVHL